MDTQHLLTQAQQAVAACTTLLALEQVKVDFLGKKGAVTELLKGLGQLAPEDRATVGQQINSLKQHVQALLDHKKGELAQAAVTQALQQETLDVTLPGRHLDGGSRHPVSLARERMCQFFSRVGFQIMEGPEIEDDFHNFAALNVPEHHPARAMHDTFYVDHPLASSLKLLLRTHTSSVQIRTLEQHAPPLRVITPGRVYRCDSDLTHTPMFHQLEGLVVDKSSSFADLKGLLLAFMRDFFDMDCDIRLRPSYFPFTEPSAEVDVQCVLCRGKGCRVCKQTGWLEVLGCGMIHPHVLTSVGVDANEYSSFAFGLGIDRFAMLRYQIPDLRLMFDNDLRFLEQFV